jgi:Ca2+-binding EF-hand superfamily protein
VKGISEDEVEIMFDALDTNRDGILSINEFCICLEGI